MAHALARDAEDFARLMLHAVERLGEGGAWVAARDAFEHTAAGHPDHAFLARIRDKPARRISLTAALERVRLAEFPQLERRKAGTRRNAPVLYRTARPDPALDLALPYDVAPSHPLLVRRRADEAAQTRTVSARRAALTAPPPTSPWRRRLLRRVAVTAGAVAPVWSPRPYWARLRHFAAALAARLTRS
jgi:hypothetical protein